MLPPELAGPIDELMKTDLQLWRDGCFAWLLISTAIVGIGILFEGPEVWHQTIGTFRQPGRNTPSWVTLLASFGCLLIAAGVIGEGITEAMVSKADGNLQTFNNIVLAEAQRESAFALERAAHAEATARGFDVQIAKSNAAAKSAEATAKGFEAQIAGAQRDAAESKKETARLTKEAESERLARMKLQKQISPRRLTGQQKETLRKVLEVRTVPIAVGWSPMDSEAADLAGDFVSALSDAHWHPVAVGWIPNQRYGVFVAGTDPEIRNTPEWKLLSEALSKIDMPPSFLTLAIGDNSLLPAAESHVLCLLIGTRPPVSTE